jgi:hypothetical protein
VAVRDRANERRRRPIRTVDRPVSEGVSARAGAPVFSAGVESRELRSNFSPARFP